MTPSEKYISALSKESFLSFWSYSNPIGKKLDKELCDILIVCSPNIIIFSIKDINIKDSGNYDTDFSRWQRKAIDESIHQIYGAERIIQQKDCILLKDRKTKIKLPEKDIRNIYRIAVVFGSKGKFPINHGDFGKGYVHVFDEYSIKIILTELDTVTDFTDFLKAKEQFTSKSIKQIAYSMEDYLALYLHKGFDFPESANILLIESGYWDNYSKSPEYLKEKKQNEISYLWDSLIESLYADFKTDNLLEIISHEELEIALRLMNKETRFSRRRMSQLLKEFLGDGVHKPKIKSRIVFPELDDAPLYVFLIRPHQEREFGRKELYLRCLVARSLFQDRKKVIGIATEPYQKGFGYSLDLYYLDLTDWSDEQQKQAEAIKEDLGYFKSPISKKIKA